MRLSKYRGDQQTDGWELAPVERTDAGVGHGSYRPTNFLNKTLSSAQQDQELTIVPSDLQTNDGVIAVLRKLDKLSTKKFNLIVLDNGGKTFNSIDYALQFVHLPDELKPVRNRLYDVAIASLELSSSIDKYFVGRFGIRLDPVCIPRLPRPLLQQLWNLLSTMKEENVFGTTLRFIPRRTYRADKPDTLENESEPFLCTVTTSELVFDDKQGILRGSAFPYNKATFEADLKVAFQDLQSRKNTAAPIRKLDSKPDKVFSLDELLQLPSIEQRNYTFSIPKEERQNLAAGLRARRPLTSEGNRLATSLFESIRAAKLEEGETLRTLTEARFCLDLDRNFEFTGSPQFIEYWRQLGALPPNHTVGNDYFRTLEYSNDANEYHLENRGVMIAQSQTLAHETGHSVYFAFQSQIDPYLASEAGGGWQQHSTYDLKKRNPIDDSTLDIMIQAAAGPIASLGEQDQTQIKALLKTHSGTVSSAEQLLEDVKQLPMWDKLTPTKQQSLLMDPAIQIITGSVIHFGLEGKSSALIAGSIDYTVEPKLILNGRVYIRDAGGQWQSYSHSARKRAVSDYQFSGRLEWFAEAYEAFYDPRFPLGYRLLQTDQPTHTWFAAVIDKLPTQKKILPA